MKHTLVLLRHGKSAYPQGVYDKDRPLARRGIYQARKSGEWINKHVGDFDVILCSSATRTRQTLQEAGLVGPVEYLDELYNWSHRAYLDTIRKYGGDLTRVALVGHEPAISATALALMRTRDTKPALRLEHKYPTSGVAVLKGKRTFADLETGRMELVDFHVPPHPPKNK